MWVSSGLSGHFLARRQFAHDFVHFLGGRGILNSGVVSAYVDDGKLEFGWIVVHGSTGFDSATELSRRGDG